MLAHNTSLILLGILCIILISSAILITRSKSLLFTIIFMALYSVIICCTYLMMDAPDVAMTEAAIGACLTTVIFLTILPKLESEYNIPSYFTYISAILLCSALAWCLIYLGYDMVNYSSYNAVHTGDSAYYLTHTKQDINLPSFVASILASYRGFDTLGETTVIMMAGLAVLLILGIRRGNNA